MTYGCRLISREYAQLLISCRLTWTPTSKDLYPRLALSEALAQFKSRHERRAACGDDVAQASRAFLDSFAYFCDVQKGDATVTAAGLQSLPHNNILWLAANEGIRNDDNIYAESILSKLKDLDADPKQIGEDDILRLAVEKCSSRITTYWEEMQSHALSCRMQLRIETRNDTGYFSTPFVIDPC